jgi:hypothetical protein
VTIYSISADIIVFLHLLWIIFLIFGAFPGRRYKLVKIAHIGGVIFAVFIQVFGWYCPLTHLEAWLRTMHDPSQSYSGSFIIHYIEKLVYIGISPKIILLLTALIALMSVYVYLRKSK